MWQYFQNMKHHYTNYCQILAEITRGIMITKQPQKENNMFTKIKETVSSREFQTGVGQIGIAVASIVVSSVVSKLVNQTLNAGLDKLMDRVHGTEETPAAE
jgi:heme O synthase-like polyprenyltransferase